MDKLVADYRVKDVYKDISTEVNYSTYSKFVTEANEALMSAVIYDNLEIKLPSIGSISIKKSMPSILDKDGNLKKKALKVNYGATNKLWKEKYPDKTWEQIKAIPDKTVVYHVNKHSDGFIFKFVWDKLTSNLPHKSFYRFKAARYFTRLLASELKNNSKLDFYEIKKVKYGRVN